MYCQPPTNYIHNAPSASSHADPNSLLSMLSMFLVLTASGVILKALLNVVDKTVQNVNKLLTELTASSVNRAFVQAQISLGFTSRGSA